MAHFAKLDENNVVTNVVVIGNSVPTSNGPLGENDMHPDGEAYCTKLLGGNWKQTSYNSSFRKQYAGKGYTYDPINDVFILPQPYASWTLDSNFDWQPPVVEPQGQYRQYVSGVDDNNEDVLEDYSRIYWDEENQRWIAVTHDIPAVEYVWNPDTSTYTAL